MNLFTHSLLPAQVATLDQFSIPSHIVAVSEFKILDGVAAKVPTFDQCSLPSHLVEASELKNLDGVPAQVATLGQCSLPSHLLEASELKFPDSVATDSEPVANAVPPDEETVDSGITHVPQLPFSLASHDQANEDVASDAPLFVRCPTGNLLRLGFASCDLAVHSWQSLPSSFLVPQVPTDFAGTFGEIYAGGGLVMMVKCAKQAYHIVVSNPTNKSQRELPAMIDFIAPEVEILGIFVDSVTMSYKIYVVHRKFDSKEMDLVAMQQYDSNLKSWEFAGRWRNRFNVDPIGAAYVKGTLFFLTHDRKGSVGGQDPGERAHHIYYLVDVNWQRLDLPIGISSQGFPAIFKHGGSLMLGGGIHDQDNVKCSNCLQSVHIWEHDWEVMQWVDVCTMPEMWVEELDNAPEERRCTFDITAGGNFVCVASSNGRVAKCDITQNEWSWLPKFDLEPKYADGERNLIVERNPAILA